MNMTGTVSAEEWLEAASPGALRYAFPGVPEQVREARKLVESLFNGTGRETDAGLVVDELANNGILYTRSGEDGGWFGVEVAFGTLGRIGVADLGGAGWLIGDPHPRSDDHRIADEDLTGFYDPDLESISLGGRGLAIVAELAVTTGAHGSDTQGHFVWADLALPTIHYDPKPLTLLAS